MDQEKINKVTTDLQQKYPEVGIRSINVDEKTGQSTFYLDPKPKTLAYLERGGVVPKAFKEKAAVITRDTLDRSFLDLAQTDPLRQTPRQTFENAINYYYTEPLLGSTVNLLAGLASKGFEHDIDDEKILLARKMGAQYAVNSNKTNLSSYIKDLTNGKGVDAVIEAAGIAETVRQAVSVAAFAGRIAFIGYTKKAVELETKLIVQKELDIYGSRNALNVFPDVIRMLEERKFPYPDLISCLYPFEQTGQALKDWDKNPAKFMKILIQVNNKKG